MNARQRFWKRLRQRLARPGLRRRAIAARKRHIWCELLEPRLALAAPVAVNDGYSALENVVPLNVSAPGILANDRDADGNLLSAMIVAGPARGTLSLGTNGAFTYTPYANFFQGDSFTYRVSDGALQSNPATVFLLVDCDCNPRIGPMPVPINFPPVAVNDAYSTAKGTPLTIFAPGVLTNDTDVEFGPVAAQFLTASIVGTPANGTLSLLPTGGFQYIPNQPGPCVAPFVGIDSFTYRVSDGSAQSNLATVTISVTGLGEPPIPIGIPIAAMEDTPVGGFAPGLLSITVPPGPCAPPGTPPAVYTFTGPVSLVTPPQRGFMTVNPDGSYLYIPHANFNGYDNFTFRAFNAQQQEVLTLATMVVAPVNDPPQPVNDMYASSEDVALTVAVGTGVLANDSDVEGNTLSASLVTPPARGIVALAPNGSFTYTPAPNFFGQESFTYRASDGLLGSLATVTIVVTGVNDVPIAVNDQFTTVQDVQMQVNAPGVLVNDADMEGDALTAVLVTNAARGTVTLNANGSFRYVPNPNFSGVDSFTYRASDATLSSGLGTVTIQVQPCNDAPYAANDSYNLNEDAILNIAAPGILANDRDSCNNNEQLPFASLASGPAHGLLQLSASGGFTYTPHANYFGPDSFAYRASDGVIGTNVATVTLNVQGVNDAPVANNDVYSVPEDTPLNINFPGVLANDTDVDGDALLAQLVTGPRNGILSLNATGRFVYTPFINFHGVDSFTYRANDGSLNGNAATVSINVTTCGSCNPLAINDAYSVPRNSVLNIGAPGVLANDADVEGNSLTASLVAAPANGTLSLGITGAFRYTPNTNFIGTDSFTYRSSDGVIQSNTATVTLSVTAPQNSPPVAVNDTYPVSEDTPLVVLAPGVLANDTDVDGNQLLAVLVSGPAHGTVTLNANGGFVYTPAPNYFGPDSFRYCANDGLLDSNNATVTLNVQGGPDAPVAVNDAYTGVNNNPLTIAAPGVLSNDFDADNDLLVATLITQPPPASGTLTLNPNGGFTFTPTNNFEGLASFTYRATDGTLNSNLATVSLSIFSSCQHPPVAVGESYSTNEDTSLLVPAPGVLSNDAGCIQRPLTASLLFAPRNGTISLSADGSFLYTPSANFHGADSFTYHARDGQLTSQATVTITVAPVNDPPVAVHDFYTVPQQTPLNVAAPGILTNDIDVDGDTLLASVVSSPANGTLSLNVNGAFRYTPNLNFIGTDSFTYRNHDGVVPSNTATVTINLTVPPNSPPVSLNDIYSFPPSVPITVNPALGLLANDTDADGDTLTAALVAPPQHGTLSLNANGGFTYTPPPNFFGSVTFTYRASDGIALGNQATVALVVCDCPNVPPVAVNDSFHVARNQALSISVPGVLANDVDANGDAILAVLVTSPAHGTLSLGSTGAFTYLPNQNFTGADSFTYFARDGQSNSNIATVTLQILDDLCRAPICPGDISDDQYTLTEDVPLTVPAPGVLANDGDFEDLPVSAVLLTGPARGTLTLNPNGSFLYAPQPNFNGVDSFTYRAYDGTAYSNVARVTLTVTPVNDVPVATPDSFTAPGCNNPGPLEVSAPGVLANDFDVEGNLLTPQLVIGPTKGTLTLHPNGSFRYLPDPNAAEPDSFAYRVSDGTLTSNLAVVTLTPPGAACPPLAMNDAYSGLKNTPLTVAAAGGVLANDVSDASLGATVVALPAHGTLALHPDGSFAYTPQANFTGLDSFTYRASDDVQSSNVATVTINVGSSNVPPSFVKGPDVNATDESGSQTIVNWATQISPGSLSEANQTLTFLVTTPTPGLFAVQPAIDPTGRLTFTPAPNASGIAQVTIRLQDSGGGNNTSLPQTFAIAITKLHPGHNTRNPLDTNDDGFISPIDWVAIEAYLQDHAPGPVPGNATVGPPFYDVNGDGLVTMADRYLVYSHMSAANQVPSFWKGANQNATDESGPVSVAGWATHVLAGPPSEAAQLLTFIVTTNNSSLFAVPPAIDSTGRLSYQPAPNASGTAELTVKLRDGGGQLDGGNDTSPPQTFTITIAKPRPGHNVSQPVDTDGDGFVAPIDAVLVINYLNGFRAASLQVLASSSVAYLDVDGDNVISPTDAVMVINVLNARPVAAAAEGEGTVSEIGAADSAGASAAPDDLTMVLELLALDVAQSRPRKRLR